MKRICIGVAFIISLGWGSPARAGEGEATAPATNLAPSLFQLEAGGAFLDAGGNIRFYQRYVTPPEGGYPSSVGVTYLASDGSGALELRALHLGEPSAGGEMWALLAQGDLLLQGSRRQSRFFRDWSDDGQAITRVDGAYEMTLPTRGGALSFSYQDVRLDSPSGEPGDNWRVDFPAFGVAGLVHGWQTALESGRERFAFASRELFSGHTNVVSLRLAPPISERAMLEMDAALFQTTLDAGPGGPRDYRFGMTGSHFTTPDLTLHGTVTYDAHADAVARSAYAKRDRGVLTHAEYHGLRNAVLDFGGGVQRVDYVNGAQTEVISADRNTLFADGAVRLSRQLRLKAGGRRWWTNNRPPAADAGDPGGSLVWSDRDERRMELSYTPVAQAGLTANWRAVDWTNRDAGAENALDERSLSGWWMPRETLTLYATALRHRVDLRGDFNGDPYLTDADVAVVGAAWQLTPALSLDASYTRARNVGAETSRQRGIALGAAYRWASGTELLVRAILDDFDARGEALPLAYTGNWYEVRLSRALF